MNNSDNLQQSFLRYINQQLSAEEAESFLEHLKSGKDEEEILALIALYLDSPVTEAQLSDRKVLTDLDRSLAVVQQRISDMGQKRRQFPFLRVAAAAAVLLVSFLALFLYKQYSPSGNKQQAGTTTDIGPGKNGATLTLANGKQIKLADALKGELADEAGVMIQKTADGALVYHIKNQEKTGGNNINTLSTQKGETYMLVLPDHSKVWLNAATSLKYPSKFAAHERVIELNGEAYFEIAKAKLPNSEKPLPFKVKTVAQTVAVLGTHFNINAYTDQPDTKTTLVEGSVQVSTTSAAKQSRVVLIPGQQSVLTRDRKIAVAMVDVDKAVAWKNGKFIFENESIETIMRELSRWYDVEVIYQGDVSNRIFTGSVSRKSGLAGILSNISYTESVHFKIEGRRVTVMP